MSWMEPRKIIKIGEKSYAITLPKKWAKILGIKPGDSVNLTMDKNGVIHVYLINKKPKKEEGFAIVLDASKLSLNELEECLRGCYIEGLDSIIIKNLKRDEFKPPVLNDIIVKLPGVIILEPGPEDIVLKIAITEDIIDLDEVVTRMSHILENMFDYMESYINTGKNDEGETILKLDDELDRLYHLGQRLIRKKMRAKIMSSRNYLDLLDYLMIITNLEHIGDCLDRGVRILLGKEWKDIQNELRESVLKSRKIVFDTISGIRYPNLKILSNLRLRRRELKQLLRNIVLKKPEFSGVVNEFELISTLSTDIAEVTVFRYLRKQSE